jgi:hypothetical protein
MKKRRNKLERAIAVFQKLIARSVRQSGLGYEMAAALAGMPKPSLHHLATKPRKRVPSVKTLQRLGTAPWLGKHAKTILQALLNLRLGAKRKQA